MKSYLKLNINRNSEKDNIITNGGSLDGSVVKNPPAKAGYRMCKLNRNEIWSTHTKLSKIKEPDSIKCC